MAHAVMTIIDELEWRGMVSDCTDTEALTKKLSEDTVTLYCGFDPTSDSLHVGNLVPLLALRRFQLFGHHPIALAGGATGSIGDPSGKSVERNLLSKAAIKSNIDQVSKQLAKFLDFDADSNPAKLVNNADWTAQISFLDFLRDVGKHFSVNKMVAKESVRARMEDREVGISYTEFSYMLLQAFDFYHLCEANDCLLQIGGADQWGNITAGIELCHKKLRRQAYGLTLPLITNADGSKFGKSEAGAIWLDAEKTSVYKFYQFWIRTDDRDVVRYLRYFTFLSQEEIASLAKSHEEDPGRREAHRALAKHMTEMIHSEHATAEAERATQVLFGGSINEISEASFEDITAEIPSVRLERSRFEADGIGLIDLFVEAGLANSKGQARKDIQGGGANVNNVRETEIDRQLTETDLLFNKYLLLRKGKRNYTAVTVQ